MAHTPGPWKIDGSYVTTSINTDEKHIAMVNWWKAGSEADVYGEEHEANCCLIASAPTMFSLCERLDAILQGFDLTEDPELEELASDIEDLLTYIKSGMP